MKDKIKKKLIYILPAFIVMMIMLMIYAMKGMYPFGNKLTLEIDADYNYIPTFFKIRDIFYNSESFLWDFKIGSGANIYGSLVMNSIYSPLNWLVILVKRDNLVNFFDILLVIKFMCMATTMFIFIRRNFKQVDTFWQVILSIIYVFSGWGLLMYSNIFFIDTIILFPIVMHYLIKFFKEGKSLGLIITLSYSAILNIYLTYMVYLFVIFSSLLAIIFFVDKTKRKETIVKLSFSLLFPLFISAIATLPTTVQIIGSIRLTQSKNSSYFSYFFLKFSNLTMSALIVIIFIKYLKNAKKDEHKTKLFLIITIFLTTIGVIIEPINKIWHTGSYNAFPYRYSFISIFTAICGCAKYFSTTNLTNEKARIKSKDIFIIILLCLIVIVIFSNKFGTIIVREMIAYDIAKPGVFLTLIIVFMLFMITYSTIFKIKNKKIQKIMICIVLSFEIGIYSNWCFNDYGYNQSNIAIQYKNQIELEEDNLYKYVDYQAKMGVNSSYILRRPTLSNWIHIIPKKQQEYSKKFGYAYSGSLFHGYGGTIISDSVIGTKYIYSQLELPSKVFELVKTFDADGNQVYMYQIIDDISFGFKYKNKIEQPDVDSMFDEQNYYYKQLFGLNKNIIHRVDINVDDKYAEHEIKNSEPVILYLEVTGDLLKSNDEETPINVTINNEEISIGNAPKIVYIDEYDKNINIKIERESKEEREELKPVAFKYGYIRISDYKEITKLIKNDYNTFEFKKNKMHINIDSEDEQYLFLPINNIEGWSAKVNGKKINIEDELYTFMSIKLEKGNNDIELEFIPPLLEEGMLISVLSILLLIVYEMFENKISKTKFIQNIIVPLYYIISFSMLVYVYIISNFIYR